MVAWMLYACAWRSCTLCVAVLCVKVNWNCGAAGVGSVWLDSVSTGLEKPAQLPGWKAAWWSGWCRVGCPGRGGNSCVLDMACFGNGDGCLPGGA
eukprot:6617352-Ditylum_brightwellii.AAC.1